MHATCAPACALHTCACSRMRRAGIQTAQYDLAKIATSAAGCPVMKHVCGPAGWSKGKQRSVACVSSLICFSWSSLPTQPPRAHLPVSVWGWGVGG